MLQPGIKQQLEQELPAYSNFITNYLNKKFLSNLVNSLVYHADLTLVIPSSNNIEIFNFLKQFTYSLTNDLKNTEEINIPKKHYFALLGVIKRLIDVKEDISFSFINYENLFTHIKTQDQFVENILQDVVDNPITDTTAFQKVFDSIIQDIQIYNQMQIIKSAIFKWDVFIKDSHNESYSDNDSALNWVKKFKDTIIEANNGLSELTVLKKNESATDYLIFSDKESISKSLTSIFSFLKNSYKVYKTDYDIIDDNLSGIESSSVSIISGPSNHAKSIFMLNIARNMMMYNESESDDDAFVFITLEDDINKLFKRILSIFGNYDNVVVKKLFLKTSEVLQNSEQVNVLGKDITESVTSILNDITVDSIISVTQGKKKFIIKHSSENSFSMNDAMRFIDTLDLSGCKVKALFID